MLSQLFATHQKLKSLKFKQFHFSFVNSKIWKETSESRNFAAIKQFNKMKKKFIILPVVAMLMVCGFSACSQDDDLFEYDLGNDEVATLAKRSMPRNGEVIIPPESQDPSRTYRSAGVTFDALEYTATSEDDIHYDGLSQTVIYSFILENGVPEDVQLEYYYPIEGDFSVENVSLGEGKVPGHYILTCEGLDNLNGVEYIGTAEVII